MSPFARLGGWILMKNYFHKISSILIVGFLFIVCGKVTSYASINWESVVPITSVELTTNSFLYSNMVFKSYNTAYGSAKGYIFVYRDDSGICKYVVVSSVRDPYIMYYTVKRRDGTQYNSQTGSFTSLRPITINEDIVYYYEDTTLFGNIGTISGGYPLMKATNLKDAIIEFLNYNLNENLGYIDDVGYHVDGYGIQNNPIGTNELISWGQFSTTGIDLDSGNYNVEIAIQDTSVELYNSAYDILNGISPFDDKYNVWVDFAMSTLERVEALFFKEGSPEKALLNGQAANTVTTGMMTSVCSVISSKRKASFNGMYFYKNYFADISDDSLFKKYVDSMYLSQNNNDWWNRAMEQWNTQGTTFNLSYDIYARIVNNSTGQKGDFLMIQKHNTPYIASNDESRLNGGVTAVYGYRFPDYNPTDKFTPAPAPVPVGGENEDSFIPTNIKTGYVDTKEGTLNINEGDIVNYYDNSVYIYDYRDYLEQNIKDDDMKNVESGFNIAKYMPAFLGIYLSLFSAFLPNWASGFVAVAIPIIVSLIVFRAVKGVIPFV